MDHAYVGYFHIWPPQANNMNKSWTMVNMVKTITNCYGGTTFLQYMCSWIHAISQLMH
jgi:chitinase